VVSEGWIWLFVEPVSGEPGVEALAQRNSVTPPAAATATAKIIASLCALESVTIIYP
jgi:hypothetical protein